MSESSDRELLDLIRRCGPLTVVEMAASLGVTGTAIRNRLARLLGTGLVERQAEHQGPRAAPAHLPGQRRGAEAAGSELCRPGRRALGRADEHGSGPQAAAAPVHPGHRPSRRDLSMPRSAARSGKGGWSSSPTCSTTGESRPKWPGTPAGRSRSCASIPAPTTSWPRPIAPSAPSSGRCSRKCWGGACGSASAGSTATASATSRPSRSDCRPEPQAG